MNNPFHSNKNKIPDFLSRFDSSTDMVNGLASFHHGNVFKKVSTGGPLYSKLINSLPASWRKKFYTYGGMYDATSYKKLPEIDAEEISRWVFNLYPEKKYPAIAIGSSNGALSHLYTALGIPWLPQTFLVPINKGEKHSVDVPEETIRWSESAGAVFLNNNPDWRLTQMMDPVQDRIRSGIIAYFRIKKLKLGPWYTKFIKERLQTGGTIFIADCNLKWPVITIGHNHTFQFGGLGTYQPEEYYYGSKRITSFLKDVKSDVEHWQISEPDSQAPEAEWGLDEALTSDILQLAEKESYKLSKISFNHPQDISPKIADMFREWYRRNNQESDRLLVESFTVHSPLLTIQTSSVPYWLFFNSEEAAHMIEKYLNDAGTYNEIYMMILSHGKTLGGVTGIHHWENILSRAGKTGQFVGMDKNKYPVDFGVFTKYTKALQKTISERYPVRQISIEDFNNTYTQIFQGNNISITSLKK